MLLNQKATPHEIIVVDQTGGGQTLCDISLKFKAEEGMIKWLRQSEPNASKARNTGALAATGEVLLFLDDDIRITPDFVAAYAETFASTNAAGVSGPVLEREGDRVTDLAPGTLASELGWLLQFPRSYNKPCETSFMMSGNFAVQRQIFLTLGGMDENYERGAYREESDFAMRFRRAGYRFHYNPCCRIVHLGPAAVPHGGARSWRQNRDFWYFHHCVGDWYFNLGFITAMTAVPLLVRSLRHFVFNRQSLERPWRMPLAAAYWLWAFPYAMARRLFGARLLSQTAVPALDISHRGNR
jgi:GT2 family glycosyltransferase